MKAPWKLDEHPRPTWTDEDVSWERLVDWCSGWLWGFITGAGIVVFCAAVFR
jgi:hypothetical protein